ncbi:MAG TPA: hypothetical protein VFV23_04125 [Verrucomicrobiae bacterium]|nr:hypothetical protein [Verrucomicrobiae bacterium]
MRATFIKHIKESLLGGILAMFVAVALFALAVTYVAYLPMILEFHAAKSLVEQIYAQRAYQMARDAFWISGVCGVVLGLTVPVLLRIFRSRLGNHDA